MDSTKIFNAMLMTTALVVGCTSQAGPDYSGEPLATVNGSIQSNLSSPPIGAEAALLWFNEESSTAVVPWTRVAVQGNFPATFELNVYEPPPDAVMSGWLGSAEPRIAQASIGVLRANADLDQADAVLGSSKAYELVYLDANAQPGSATAQYLGWPAAAGYHLIAVHTVTTADDVAACVDLLMEYEQCSLAQAQSRCQLEAGGSQTFSQATAGAQIAITLTERPTCN